jgi:CheY-like chemotaxis protein
MRILYVEDNPANVSLVKRVAREHELVNYVDGEEALRNFEKDNPDLVLMDIQLTGRLSGLDVVRELRQKGYTVPIIAVTAYAMIGDRERCLAAGCDDYMAKPLPIPDLLRLFEKRKQEIEALASVPTTPTPEVKAETPVVPTTPTPEVKAETPVVPTTPTPEVKAETPVVPTTPTPEVKAETPVVPTTPTPEVKAETPVVPTTPTVASSLSEAKSEVITPSTDAPKTDDAPKADSSDKPNEKSEGDVKIPQ